MIELSTKCKEITICFNTWIDYDEFEEIDNSIEFAWDKLEIKKGHNTRGSTSVNLPTILKYVLSTNLINTLKYIGIQDNQNSIIKEHVTLQVGSDCEVKIQNEAGINIHNLYRCYA